MGCRKNGYHGFLLFRGWLIKMSFALIKKQKSVVMKFFRKVSLAVLLGMVIFSQACKKDDNKNSKYKTVYGDPQPLGKGTIRSFIVLDATNTPTTIGMKLSSGALTGLPGDSTVEHDTPVPLPAGVTVAGFDHLEVDWNPVGHEPKAIYGFPHFDFHFYLITKEEQASVIGGPDTVTVPAVFVPNDYVSGVIAVPDMGVHWFDSKAPEFSGQHFTDTYIYGFYHGKMSFVEPMATLAFISSKPDFTVQIKQPLAYQRKGYYPTVQHLYFDESTKEYTMALEGLVYSNGTFDTK
jgi:hypothetical protein